MNNSTTTVAGQLGIEAALDAFQPGMLVFDRFTLEKLLGRSVVSTVWMARDASSGNSVALKLLPKLVLCDQAGLNHLRNAVQDARRLRHENIVRVLELLEDEHWAAIVSESVEGESLHALRVARPNGVFDPEDLNPVLGQMIEAFDHAHSEAHVLHRKLTPANVLVSTGGKVKVCDFGIARVISDCLQRATRHVGTTGELLYLSPQQLDGETASVSDDIYAIGAALFELITSHPPFHTGDVIWQIRNEEAPSMAERRAEFGLPCAGIPRPWEKAVNSCLNKHAELRPANIRVLAQKEIAVLGPVMLCPAAPVVIPEEKLEPASETPVSTFAPPPSIPLKASSVPVVLTEKEDIPVEPAQAPVSESVSSPVSRPIAEPVAAEKPAWKPYVDEDEPEEVEMPSRSRMLPALAALVIFGLLVGVGFLLRDPIRGLAGKALPQTFGTAAKTPAPDVAAPATTADPDAQEALVVLQERFAKAAIPAVEPGDSLPAPAVKTSPVTKPAPTAAAVADATPRAASAYETALAEAEAAAREAAEQARRAEALRQAAEDKARQLSELRRTEEERLGKVRADAKAAAAATSEKEAAAAGLSAAYEEVRVAAEKAAALHQEKMQAAQQAQADARKAVAETEALAREIAALEESLVPLREKHKTLAASIETRKTAADAVTADAGTARTAVEESNALRTARKAETDRALAEAAEAKAAEAKAAAALKTAEEAFASEFSSAGAPAPTALEPPVTLKSDNAGVAPKKPASGTNALTEQARAAVDSENWTLNAPAPKPRPVAVSKPSATVSPSSAGKPAKGSFDNSLGMHFVPVGPVHFSVHETRLQDFEKFVEETKHTSNGNWKKPGFQQKPDHPVVNVSWNDAIAFCKWLTARDRADGKIVATQAYRLPTDVEWSFAAGLDREEGATPEARDMGVTNVYPWGTTWPPPAKVGNYTGTEAGAEAGIPGYEDGFIWTAPVGSFAANRYGLYDMGGNAWEWCMDWWNKEQRSRVLRGASWYNGGLKLSLLTSCRICGEPGSSTDNYGFRVVLAADDTSAAAK